MDKRGWELAGWVEGLWKVETKTNIGIARIARTLRPCGEGFV